ncbi:MAG: acetylxylan esterase [Deltaproteobacteria bacterium]|nr:acetylxylan esterase [Deltaproteobacteria bacterium]
MGDWRSLAIALALLVCGACGGANPAGDAGGLDGLDGLPADEAGQDGDPGGDSSVDGGPETDAGDGDGWTGDGLQADGDAEAGDGDAEAGDGDASGDGDAPADGDGPVEPLFDLAAIRDPSTASCSLTNPRTVLQDGELIDVWDLSYLSWESLDGALSPIRIRAFAARPAGASGALPGVVRAHGLGGFAEPEDASTLAAMLDVCVAAYSGPGSGSTPENSSEGLGPMDQNGYRMFDTLRDVRGSWFWAHAVAGMRALTCLETLDEVDRTRLGMTGFSAGAVATLISAGVDDRIKAAVPLSGTGAWDVATRSPNAWQHDLLAAAGLGIESPEWLRLMDALIAPSAMIGQSRSAIMMVDGTCDEFFPLTAFEATCDAIPGDEKRISLAGNFDHGCYGMIGVESEETIAERADLHAKGAMRMWFGHWLGTEPDFSTVPDVPVVSVQSGSPLSLVAALVDESPAALEVEEVTFWWSDNDAYFFWDQTLEPGSGYWQAYVPMTLQANSIFFLDVQYRSRDLLFPKRFTISSPPSLPADLVPRIRAIGSCQ